MRKTSIIILLTAIAIFGLSVSPTSNVELTRAHASVDATAAWNSVCDTYGFPQAPVGNGGTFADNWPTRPMFGTSCQTQLTACCAAVAQILGTPDPGFGDGDIFNGSIQNWPN
jgi:hypothetical protein